MATSYRFGPFAADASSYQVSRQGAALALSPKPIDLLLYLAARPSVLVPKEELLTALWPDVNVTDNALTQAVSELRQALGDDPSHSDVHPDRGAPRVTGSSHPWRPWLLHSLPPRSSPTRPRRSRPVVAVLDFANVSADQGVRLVVVGYRGDRDERPAGLPATCASSTVCGWWRRCGEVGYRALGAARGRCTSTWRSSAGSNASAAQLRITARAVDARTGESIAEAKADGLLEQVFDLQDRIVSRFVDILGAPAADAPPKRGVQRETSSLEAYQALDGRTHQARKARRVAGRRRPRRLRTGDRPRSPLSVGSRRPGQRAVLAVRDVARAQSPGRRAPRARHRPGAARHRAGRRSRGGPATLSYLLVSGAPLRRGAERGAARCRA